MKNLFHILVLSLISFLALGSDAYACSQPAEKEIVERCPSIIPSAETLKDDIEVVVAEEAVTEEVTTEEDKIASAEALTRPVNILAPGFPISGNIQDINTRSDLQAEDIISDNQTVGFYFNVPMLFDTDSKAKTSITLSGLETDIDLELFTAMHEQVGSSTNMLNEDETISGFLEPGVYFLKVYNPGEGQTNFTVNIRQDLVEAKPLSEIDPGSDLESALDMSTLERSGEAIEFYQEIKGEGDIDVFKVKADKSWPATLSVQLNMLPQSMDEIGDAKIEVFAGDRSEPIAVIDEEVNASESSEVTIGPGDIYIKVSDYSGEGKFKYHLKVEVKQQ